MSMIKPAFMLLLMLFAAVSGFAQSGVKKAVFIIVDGIPADVVEKVNTPNLDRIAAKGNYLRAFVGGIKGSYSQTPTISAVSYNSLLTGTWVNKHNVWDNDIKEPNYHYPTIFRLFEDQYPDKKTAIFSSWTDNRTKLVGEGQTQTGRIKLDEHHDGYELDTVTFPHDKQRDFMHRIDEQVATDAATSIRENSPDLSWVYLEYTDDMGHMYGDSKQFYAAVEKMDRQIGRIWEAIEYRQKTYKEEWMIIITTDHGRDAKTGKDHGGQSKRERNTWIVTNYARLNPYAAKYQPGIVDIMPTLARFMNVEIPEEAGREIDGISMIGKVSIARPVVKIGQQTLTIQWDAITPGGSVKIELSTTNNHKTGGKDEYQVLGEVPLKNGAASFSNLPLSDFYKIVLKAEHNTVNCWADMK